MTVINAGASDYVDDPRNPVVLHTYHHLRSWFAKPWKLILGISVVEDIFIGTRATLTMTSTVRGLYANDITIGDDGTLRFEGGAVHVKCRTLNGPNPFAQERTTLNTYGKYLVGLSGEAMEDER